MITFIKKLFGLEKPVVVEAKAEVPYKVEAPAPAPEAVVVAEIVPVSFADIPVTIAPTKVPAEPKATVKKQRPEKKPAAVKTPSKPRAPRKPVAK